MPQPYFAGTRAVVMAAMRAGAIARAAAARFGVSPATAARWARLAARTGALEPGRPGPRARRRVEAGRDWLRAEVAARPGATVAALREGLRARGVEVSRATVWRALRDEGLGVGERGTRAGVDAHGLPRGAIRG